MIGQTIAHYRITAKLGQDGMSEVYRAVEGTWTGPLENCFQASGPKVLFDTGLAGGITMFDVSRDGRFLIPVLVEEAGVEAISVVINWTAGLKK